MGLLGFSHLFTSSEQIDHDEDFWQSVDAEKAINCAWTSLSTFNYAKAQTWLVWC
jgi:hypothetical protein